MNGFFGSMKVHCPICKAEIDGMRTYGRDSHCCDKECHEEWEWRRTLAILKKAYYPRPGSRWDPNKDVEEFVQERACQYDRGES